MNRIGGARGVDCRVVRGRGLATHKRTQDLANINDSLGLSLVHGSLNLVSRRPVWLDSRKAIHVSSEGSFFWHASLNGIPVLISRWSGNCPVHIFEVYADRHLRSHFGLNDGDMVDLRIADEVLDVQKNRWFDSLIWYLVWYGREELEYRGGRYFKLTRHWRFRKIRKRITHNPERLFIPAPTGQRKE